jgi:hypothetical protein
MNDFLTERQDTKSVEQSSVGAAVMSFGRMSCSSSTRDFFVKNDKNRSSERYRKVNIADAPFYVENGSRGF